MNARKILPVAIYSVLDELNHKSVYVLLGIGLFFVLILGGFYKGNYQMNGATITPQDIVQAIAAGAFQFFSFCGIFLASLLAARALRNDRDSGTLVFMLSKPIARRDYLAGKLLGLFMLCFLFAFVLHAALFVSTYAFSLDNIPLPGIFLASLIYSLALLFTVCLVMLFSLFLPDFISIILSLGIVIAGYLAGPLYMLLENFARTPTIQTTVIKFLCVAWPKVGSLQSIAASFIDGKFAKYPGALHPAINLGIYTVVLLVALFALFDKKEL